jgi:hypothetical protein
MDDGESQPEPKGGALSFPRMCTQATEMALYVSAEPLS